MNPSEAFLLGLIILAAWQSGYWCGKFEELSSATEPVVAFSGIVAWLAGGILLLFGLVNLVAAGL